MIAVTTSMTPAVNAASAAKGQSESTLLLLDPSGYEAASDHQQQSGTQHHVSTSVRCSHGQTVHIATWITASVTPTRR